MRKDGKKKRCGDCKYYESVPGGNTDYPAGICCIDTYNALDFENKKTDEQKIMDLKMSLCITAEADTCPDFKEE